MPEVPAFRLVVTGSREYDDEMSLRASLDKVFDSIPVDVTLVVVSGGERDPELSTGPARIAGKWAAEMEAQGLPVRSEVHQAGWENACLSICVPGHRYTWRGVSLCPSAGEYRNEEMCAAGMNRGLAALRVGTKSTDARDCISRMARHGFIPEILVQGVAEGLPGDLTGRQI